MTHAWRAATLARDLDAAESAYLNDTCGVRVGPNGALTLSKTYMWFRKDFGDTKAEVLRRRLQVAKPGLAEAFAARFRVSRCVLRLSYQQRRSAMMGRLETQANLFHRFRIEDHVPQDHPFLKP